MLMLEKFGYMNVLMLGIGLAVMVLFVDFQTPAVFDITLIGLFSLTLFVHAVRLFVLMTAERR